MTTTTTKKPSARSNGVVLTARRDADPKKPRAQQRRARPVDPEAEAPPEAAERPEADLVAEIRKLAEVPEQDRFARTDADRRIGLLYLAADPHIARYNGTRDEWVMDRMRMDPRDARECARLPGLWDKFLDAHGWLCAQGEEAGWAVRHRRGGAGYAVAVIKAHRDFLAGRAPGQRERERKEAIAAKAAAEGPPETAKDLREAVAELEAEVVARDKDIEELRQRARRDRDYADETEKGAIAVKRRAERLERRVAALEAVLRAHRIQPPLEDVPEEAPEVASAAGPPPPAPPTVPSPAAVCSVEGCADKAFGKGFCRKHYDRDRYRHRRSRLAASAEPVDVQGGQPPFAPAPSASPEAHGEAA